MDLGLSPEELSRLLQECRSSIETPEIARLHRFTHQVWKAGIEAVFSRFTPEQLAYNKRRIQDSTALMDLELVGTRNVLAIVGGRLPDPTATLIVWSLLFGARLLVKPPGEYPAFAEGLIGCIRRKLNTDLLQYIDPKVGALEVLIREADHLLLFGSDETVKAVASMRLPRSFTYFRDREAVEVILKYPPPEVILKVALDIAMYDQSGCLSPHVVLLQGPWEDGLRFGQELLYALLEVQRTLPLLPPSLDERARIRLFTEAARHQGGVVLGESLIPQVIVTNTPLFPGPGYRVIQVVPFEDFSSLKENLRPLEGRIQGIALYPKDLQGLLQKSPFDSSGYVTSPGRLQSPPLLWVEDGLVLPFEFLRVIRRG